MDSGFSPPASTATPGHESAGIAVNTCREYAADIDRIEFVCFDEETAVIYERLLATEAPTSVPLEA